MKKSKPQAQSAEDEAEAVPDSVPPEPELSPRARRGDVVQRIRRRVDISRILRRPRDRTGIAR